MPEYATDETGPDQKGTDHDRDARSDADTNLSSLRSGLEQLLRDLRDAYDAAEAVVRRRPPTALGRDRVSPS